MKRLRKCLIVAFLILSSFSMVKGGEVEKFITETLEEQRMRNAQKGGAAPEIINEAVSDIELPEYELPKQSIFTAKDRERDARYYSYDKSGRLTKVEYAASPEKNEYYSYDRQGNILEKKIGSKVYKYSYDSANQLLSMSSPEGKREYEYDRAGRLVRERLNGKEEVEYKYGYLDKVIEVKRGGKITKYAYDGFGMLAQKTFSDGTTETWVWDGLALIRRGSDIYVNEPHISGGVPILTKTNEGIRYHEHDFLGTTLWSTDTKGNLVKDYQDTTIFGEGSIQKDRSARFTGKPYDEDLQAYVFPYRNYDATTARWRTSDPAGYPDGINNQFYAAVPTYSIDILGCWKLTLNIISYLPAPPQYITNGESSIQVNVEVPFVGFTIEREAGDTLETKTFNLSGQVYFNGDRWSSVSHDFTLLSGMQSTSYTTPNLGHRSYNLSEGTYIGTVVLSAPGLNSVSGNFTVNIVEK